MPNLLRAAALVVLLFLAHPSATAATESPLVFAGSGTAVPLTRLLALAFMKLHPEVRIVVPPNIGSAGGIRAAANGAVALGLSTRPLAQAEVRLGLTAVTFARTAVVLGVHPTVGDGGITFDELIQIYRGVKTRWQDGHEIVVLTREPSDGVIDLLSQRIPGFKDAYAESYRVKRWTVLLSTVDMNRMLVRTPYALGLTDTGSIVSERLSIKALKVNGIAPTPVNVYNGRYTLVRVLAFVSRKRDLPPPVQAFIDFTLSPAAAALIRESGYIVGE